MADDWSAFPDADEGNVWADFPDAEPSTPKRGKNERQPPAAGGILSSPRAVDGDTIDAEAQRVRLLGIDAPELSQAGFDREGKPVPIGAQSRDFLQGEIANAANASLGDVAGKSYGRLVGPVALDGRDAGLAAVRSGNALAAPSYVRDNPDYRFDLMESERLARLNRLGPMNDTMAQDPAQFRVDPDWQPPRETIAQFWDTPTPFAGMRPEAEREYIGLLHTGTPAQIYAFGTGQGLGMDLAEVEKWAKWRDEHLAKGGSLDAYANYQRGPEVIQKMGDGATGAGVRGFGEGFVAGGLGELGAVADTIGATDGRESIWNSDRRIADIWANNEWQNESILRGDEHAHPTASTIGQVGGALTSGFVLPYGAGARTVPALAKVGGVYGGVEGFLGTDGGIAERLQGAVIGVPAGAAVNAIGGKALQVAAPAVAQGARALGKRLSRATNEADQMVDERGDLPNAPVDQIRGQSVESGGQRVESVTPALESPASSRAIDMEAEPMPSVSSDPIADPKIAALVQSGAGEATINAVLKQRGLPTLPLGSLKARRLLDAATDAEREAAASRVQPGDVLPLPSNAVDGPEDAALTQAGRFAEAKAPNERGELSKGTVRGWNGDPVPKVGPTDLVGWLRLRGGLKDDGGELSHMGMTNAARRGLEHVGQEARFGPLVNNETGDNLDDAAMAAWEAGYFPEHIERPSVSDFLEALRDTYNGNAGRRFHPDDWDELERFEAMRGERFDLEQLEREAGTVWNDMSMPANDAPPFPPIEAYEEWPSEAIQRVGNIDVTKLESPQDIRRALKSSEGVVGGFDAATRGRVAQAETERLASELGMTADALLSRRKGQALNAEEALAARQILAKSGNELVNLAKRVNSLDEPGDEMLAQFRQAWMRHVAIQEQVSGMTAEAGRALQQFRMAADSRAIRGDVLGAIVRGGGGTGGLKEAAETLLDAVEMGPGKFNMLAAKAAQPKWRNKLSELYINMLLSNPPTHVVNMVSNTLTSMLQLPEYATASAIGGVRRAVKGEAKDRILASEVGARTIGLLQGTKEGVRLFAQALRTGEADDFVSKIEGDEYKAIGGVKGEIIRVPTRLLTAEDQLFKGIARRMELNAQAVRIARNEGLKGEQATARIAELVADPTDDMLAKSMDYGRYLTFQRPLGEFGQGLSKITGSNLLAKVVMPFVRTPINLLKFATERSPMAPVLKEWRADIAAGGERRDLAIARSMLGTGLAAVIYEAALDGRITGAVPPDPNKAKLLYADGWQPYSVKVGDRYVSYSRLDPLSTTIGVAADMATLPQGLSDRQQDDAATMLVASIMGNLASKTWLSGVSSFVEGLTDPGRHAEGWIQRTVGAFTVPAGVAGIARAIDPVSRKREDVGDAIKARVPGMSDELLPRRDVFGEELVGDSLGPDFISPFWQTRAKDDPVVAEMLRIQKGVSAPGKQFTEDGERVDYTPEQYDRYHEIAGRLTYNSLLGLIGSGEYAGMGDNAKRKAAAKAIAKARKTAREALADPAYPLPAKGAPMQDEWEAFPAGGGSADSSDDEWGAFPDAPSRDVVSDLTNAIPGIRFTSGFRTPEYNASLRARGYNPADNSEHLDGSALDMLPPPGKSLEWLKRQVRQYDPKARLLVHDGHLHAGFNGFYSAPKLGGMAGQ